MKNNIKHEEKICLVAMVLAFIASAVVGLIYKNMVLALFLCIVLTLMGVILPTSFFIIREKRREKGDMV